MSTNEDSLINKENPNLQTGRMVQLGQVYGTGGQKAKKTECVFADDTPTTGKISKMDEEAGVCAESGGHFNVVIGKQIWGWVAMDPLSGGGAA